MSIMETVPVLPPSPPDMDSREPAPKKRPRRPWRAKLRVALRGLKLGIRGHSSFAVHFFFTALVLLAGFALRCGLVQWCLLWLCIGLVLTAELFNSAIETLFRGLDEATRDKAWPALDIAAGAVLLASLVAAIIGAAIFIERFMAIYLTVE